MTTDADRLLQQLRERGNHYRCTENHGQWRATCPLCLARDGLTITEGSGFRAVISCRSRCVPDRVRHFLEGHEWCWHCGQGHGVAARVVELEADLEALRIEYTAYREASHT